MKQPKGFLKINNTEVKELLYRPVNSLEACLRCNVLSNVSIIGANLYNFVCDICRKDDQEWDFRKREGGISYTIGAMENDILAQNENEEDPYGRSEDIG